MISSNRHEATATSFQLSAFSGQPEATATSFQLSAVSHQLEATATSFQPSEASSTAAESADPAKQASCNHAQEPASPNMPLLS